MKKDNKYRFSLQFGTDSEEEIRAGEFLELLGNRKSQIVVTALNEYLLSHPGLQDTGQKKVEVKITACYDKNKIEQIVQTMIENKLASLQVFDNTQKDVKPTSSEVSDDDVSQMLDNLDIFN